MKRAVAIDIGASSGRAIVGWLAPEERDLPHNLPHNIAVDEVYRFKNGVHELDSTKFDSVMAGTHLVWDIEQLEADVRAGIDAAIKKYGEEIESISIDTWGVDYVLLDAQGSPIMPAYAYRDNRTSTPLNIIDSNGNYFQKSVIDIVHSIIPFEELYALTGTQFQEFNTIYQLYVDKITGALDKAEHLQMMPEYLMYKLTGNLSHEYTNATTTGLLNAESGQYDSEIIEKLHLPKHLFKPLSQPGTSVGYYRGIRCVLCASHDTASAVEGIPMKPGEDSPYISSGTWSLLGAKTPRPITNEKSRIANYSNEGGVGYNRYQKNIMGMWVINRLRDELCPDEPFENIVKIAMDANCDFVVDVNDVSFLAPKSMKRAFDDASGNKLRSVGDYFSCACYSLAHNYKVALEELEANTLAVYDCLYIVGGGAKNKFLNDLTVDATGKKIIALPIEATAIGNLKIQLEHIDEHN